MEECSALIGLLQATDGQGDSTPSIYSVIGAKADNILPSSALILLTNQEVITAKGAVK